MHRKEEPERETERVSEEESGKIGKQGTRQTEKDQPNKI